MNKELLKTLGKIIGLIMSVAVAFGALKSDVQGVKDDQVKQEAAVEKLEEKVVDLEINRGATREILKSIDEKIDRIQEKLDEF